MDDAPQFLPAAAFALDTLADLFTRAFAGYFYAATISAEMMANRMRVDQIDLVRSVVMQVEGVLAGLAVVALRGDHAWCGGFGITEPFRGRRLAVPLAEAMLAQARAAGARRFSLEVLTRNTPAIAVYRQVGFLHQRDVRIMRWVRDPHTAPAESTYAGMLVEGEPRAFLAHFDALHPVPAAWQRDLPALLVRGGLRGLALLEDERPAAYVLFQSADGAHVQIADMGATCTDGARVVLQALQQRYTSVASTNEPENSTLTAAFDTLGFAEIDRQHELALDL